jgi:hypothetical protein
MELDVTAAEAGPLIPRSVDPPDEIEVINVLNRAEIRSLMGKH